jgi:hypothetical protein
MYRLSEIPKGRTTRRFSTRRASPVDAITLIDEFEGQVWPQ